MSAREAAFLFKLVENGSVDGDEFLQGSHAPEPLHGSLSSSKQQTGIFWSTVQPATSFLPFGITDDFQSNTV
jgi:hypothetical protein